MDMEQRLKLSHAPEIDLEERMRLIVELLGARANALLMGLFMKVLWISEEYADY
jgi:hypothetical protein